MTLTARVLAELAEGPGTSGEIAACLGLPCKNVAGTLSNMKKDGRIHVAGIYKPARGRGWAFIFALTP